jgi:hypothetical protein
METTMGARWGMPAFGLLIGGLLFAASAIGGQPILGLGMFAVMAIHSAVAVVFGPLRPCVKGRGNWPCRRAKPSSRTVVMGASRNPRFGSRRRGR